MIQTEPAEDVGLQPVLLAEEPQAEELRPEQLLRREVGVVEAAFPAPSLEQHAPVSRAGGVQLDVKNFCCPEYLAQMVQKIRQNWNARQGAGGQPTIKFTIRRDGMLTNVELEKPSGQDLLDLEARRAVIRTQQLPPLPREFTESSLTVHLTFDFQR